MGYGRAALWGVVIALVVLILGVVGVVFVAPGMRPPMEVPGERLMVVIAGRGGSDGSQVAQLIGVLDSSGEKLSLELVDPLTKVAVPGTSYDRLRDAYPFGGGEGVSKAWAAYRHTAAIPVVALTEEALVSVVDGAGGIKVSVPFQANVFDGARLFVFEPGERTMGGADVVALLESAEYLERREQQMAVRSSVASGLAGAFAGRPPDLRRQARSGGIASSLRVSDLEALAAVLAPRAAGITIRREQP